MGVTVNTSSIPLTWQNAVNSTWNSLSGFDWTSVPQFDHDWDNAFTFSIVDDETNNLGLNILRSLNFAETYIDNILFQLNIAESFTITDVSSFTTVKELAEAFGIVDNETNNLGLNILRSLGLSPTYNNVSSFNLLLAASLALSPTTRNHTSTGFDESFSIADGEVNEVGLNILRTLSIIEAIANVSTFARDFPEALGLSPITGHTQALDFGETLALLDNLGNGYRGALSDLHISQDGTVITESDFEDIVLNGRAPGFGNFSSFIQGDYTYTKALFKAILESTETSARTELQEFKISVDLPDVIERGQSTIVTASTGITVVYTKSFFIEPEIIISFKGGTVVAIPELSGQSLTGFTVKLRDPATTNLVTGTVSWSAHGY
jgi:hypothetical protein